MTLLLDVYGHVNRTSKPLFLPWSPFGKFWQLQAGNNPLELQLWSCSDPVIKPSILKLQYSNLLTCIAQCHDTDTFSLYMQEVRMSGMMVAFFYSIKIFWYPSNNLHFLIKHLINLNLINIISQKYPTKCYKTPE